jgi:hypothetical protein
MGLPSVYFENSPYQSLGDSLFVPLRDYDNSFEERGAVAWSKGAHNIKFGIGLIRRQALISQSGNGGLQDGARGRFDFGGEYTGFALADLLEGLESRRAIGAESPFVGTQRLLPGRLAREALAHTESRRAIRHLDALY